MVKKKYSFLEVDISKNFSSRISTHVDWEPSTNIVEAGDLLIIEVELPGVNKEDISIELRENSSLIIKGNKIQPRVSEDRVTYCLFEREFGSFFKRISIDFLLDSNKIQSEMENGVLTITVPKKEVKTFSVDIK
jgi:HSP20 family protein